MDLKESMKMDLYRFVWICMDGDMCFFDGFRG